MSDNTNLVPVNLDQLPSTQIGSDDQFADLAKSADYHRPPATLHQGQGGQQEAGRPRQLRHPRSDEEVNRPGRHHRHHPAGPPAEGHRHDRQRGDHRQLRSRSRGVQADRRQVAGKGKPLHVRPVVPRLRADHAACFLEFFCGNKSSRSEAKKVYPYLPLTQADIDAKAASGDDVSDLEPHGPLPLTLKSRLVEKGTYSWHVPVVVKCARRSRSCRRWSGS